MTLTSVYDFFLVKYEDADFITQRKARFILNFSSIFILGLIVISIYFATVGGERFISMISLFAPSIVVMMIAILFIRSGRLNFSLNFMVILASGVMILGFVLKPPMLAGVSYAYFMYLTVIFAALFTSILISTISTASFIITHVLYFMIKSGVSISGEAYDMTRTSMVDGILVLIMVYIIGIIAMRITNKAIDTSNEESRKNLDQYTFIDQLIQTIINTSTKLTESIRVTRDVINNYSDNAQSQAATVEELSATSEQISAGTHNVEAATLEQNSSIRDLILSLDILAASIDVMENYGNEISELFLTFLHMAQEGEKASDLLDITNKKIMDNSNSILSVATIIEEFFDKINLLSLNATIEAARAGEFGKGFAVVAEEIGKLADHSAQELKEITSLIAKNKEDVETGNKIITDIIEFINSLVNNIKGMQEKSANALKEIKKQKHLKDEINIKSSLVKEKSEIIELTMREQKVAMGEAVKSIEETNKIVQKNAQSTELLRTSSEELIKLAQDLNEKIQNK